MPETDAANVEKGADLGPEMETVASGAEEDMGAGRRFLAMITGLRWGRTAGKRFT